jgi:hypothetical protein
MYDRPPGLSRRASARLTDEASWLAAHRFGLAPEAAVKICASRSRTGHRFVWPVVAGRSRSRMRTKTGHKQRCPVLPAASVASQNCLNRLLTRIRQPLDNARGSEGSREVNQFRKQAAREAA